ncbi:MAG: protein-disulfide reductase DsbD domain-containing protein, partial [Terriglobales bacterium]
LLGCFVALAPASGQAPAGVAHLKAPPTVEAQAHAAAVAVFDVRIDSGFHIQSNHPKLEYLIPSSLEIAPVGGIVVTGVIWPPAAEHKFSFSPDVLTVFEGDIKVQVRMRTGGSGEHTMHGSFRYQACNDELCRPPVTVPFTFQVDVR